MTLLKTDSIPMGTPAPDFDDLPATDGNKYSLDDFAHKKALVIIFMCVHCPYVQAIEDDIASLLEEFDSDDVQIVGINANDIERYPEDDMAHMQERANEYGYEDLVYLRDDSQEVAMAYGAVCTPDIFVYNEERLLAYHGRIEEVPAALEALLADEDPSPNQIPSQGCSIKWLE